MYSAKKVFFISSFLFFSLFIKTAKAQEFFPTLEISPTPKITGMGETGTGIADDASAIFLNPGGLAFQKEFKINFTYCDWLPNLISSKKLGIHYYNISAIKNYEDLGTFSGNFFYMDFGKSLFYPSNHDAYEYYLSAGYSKLILDNLGLGLNIKYCHDNLGWDSLYTEIPIDGFGFDVGVLFKITKLIIPFVDLDLSNRISIGLNLANMGPNITTHLGSKDEYGTLPFTMRLGIGIKILDYNSHKLNWAIDFSRLMIERFGYDKPDPFYESFFTSWENGGLNSIVSSTGMEYRFCDPYFTLFGNPIRFVLRTGYFYEDENYGNRQYLTFGGSVDYLILGFNFSYISSQISDSGLDKTWKWGMSLNL
jgi:hypothetical protein